MFYIFSTYPDQGDHMNRYERAELDEMFGDANATALENGVFVFANGGIHVNARHAAAREAQAVLACALDAIGVRSPRPEPQPAPAVDQWWKRGEECPH